MAEEECVGFDCEQDEPSPDPDSEDDFVFNENSDINGTIARSMHEQHFNQPLVTESMTVEMIQKSKFLSNETKDTVLGMAYNFHNKIFIKDDIRKGNSFSNDVSQEMALTVQEILNEKPHIVFTKEQIAFELSRRGFDPRQSFEFVANVLVIAEEETGLTVAPDLVRINPIEQGMTVPNMNAKNDFIPDDTLFGGLDREDIGADTITQDKKPNLGKKAPSVDINDESDEEEKEIGIKNTKRSSNQDGFNDPSNKSDRPSNDNIGMERVHHVANSVLANTPQSMIQELEIECDPGSRFDPVTGTCTKDTDDSDTDFAGSSDENIDEPQWLKNVTEQFDCGCKNKTQEAYKILNS